MKIRGYVSEQKLEAVSRFDKLTGMQNRNAYERDLYDMPQKCRESLTCIYIDVNGLKFLNDNKGHKEGDKMLIAVAGKIRKYFGESRSYRVGGDEFIAFLPDPKWGFLHVRFDGSDMGYHVAVGWETYDLERLNDDIDCLSVQVLIEDAEKRMYRKKKDFYDANQEFDRRK